MIKSSRTKRRKTRQEINLFEEIYSNHELDENTSKVSEGQNIPLTTNLTCNVVFGNNYAVVDTHVDTAIDSPFIFQVYDDFLENVTPVAESCSVLDLPTSSPQISTINAFLANWAVEFNISRIAINGLLNGLKDH